MAERADKGFTPISHSQLLGDALQVHSDLRPKIRTFLAAHLRDRAFSDQDDIFAAGYVNSLFAMQLVLFVEKEFGVCVNDEDLEVENFKSVAAIASLVERKVSGAGTDASA